MNLRQMTAAMLAMTAAGLATAAQADSASFTITVTIPPFAEALAARDQGAAGDWTILTSGGGFLVDLPDVAAAPAEDAGAPADAPLTVYRSDLNRFTLSLDGDAGATAMTPSSVVPGANLVQVNYALPQSATRSEASGRLRVVFAGL